MRAGSCSPEGKQATAFFSIKVETTWNNTGKKGNLALICRSCLQPKAELSNSVQARGQTGWNGKLKTHLGGPKQMILQHQLQNSRLQKLFKGTVLSPIPQLKHSQKKNITSAQNNINTLPTQGPPIRHHKLKQTSIQSSKMLTEENLENDT